MKKITKRDLLFFFLGLLTCLIFSIIYDWDSFKNGFKNGWKDAIIENVK